MTRARPLQPAVQLVRRLPLACCLALWCASSGCDPDRTSNGVAGAPKSVSCDVIGGGVRQLAKAKICDGVQDCWDGADEIECPDTYLCEPVCRSRCGIDGAEIRAVPNAKRCDHHADCPLADDERDCPGSDVLFCARDDYNLMRVYEPSQVCDGMQDCYWAEDEKECPGFFECTSTGPGVESVTAEKVCDGRRDCSLGNDEDDCPAPAP